MATTRPPKTKKFAWVVEEVFPRTDAQAFKDIVILDKSLFDEDCVSFLPIKGWYWLAYECVKCADGSMVKKEPIGFAALIKRGAFAYLERGGVLKEFRGHGIQQEFISERLKKAKVLEFKTAIAVTYANPISGNNLIKEGFRLYKPEKMWLNSASSYWKLDLNEWEY